MSYAAPALHIAGRWTPAAERDSLPVLNPASGAEIGRLPCATDADIDAAAEAAERGFAQWRAVAAFDRAKVLHRAASLLRERAEAIAPILTLEQGKPLAQSRLEVLTAAEIIEWFAEEGRRSYGRLIPARAAGVRQMVVKDPVGPVAAFTPWNFPIGQAVRKLSAALCTGCSIVLKGAENTPASVMELVRAYLDAGVPSDAVSLLSGHPALISERLIAHPAIRKVSFTGSTAVGKDLAALAGRHMKRATMELGGHAPVLIFDDADLDGAVERMAAAKFRNAGQICIAPTRFMVQAPLHGAACRALAERALTMRLGDGMDPDTTMGPLAHPRRVEAMEALVEDAVARGGRLLAGGKRHGNSGNFFQATVLADVPPGARVMQEEPFGPILVVNSFTHDDDAIAEANRLPYGLAAYGFTRSAARAERLMSEVESGMVSINHQGLALIETPFGGIRDSGYGHEGGSEALDGYLNTRFLSHLAVRD